MKEASRPDPADVPTVVPGPEDADTALPSAVSSRPAAVDAKDGESLEHDGPRYDRRALLGRGGMGEVFLCADQRIGRSVAMKQIRAGVDQDPAARRRFLREARVQGQLEHPAIVPVYEVAHGADGRTYFTMKRVKGESLHEWIARVRGDDEAASESRSRLLNAFAQSSSPAAATTTMRESLRHTRGRRCEADLAAALGFGGPRRTCLVAAADDSQGGGFLLSVHACWVCKRPANRLSVGSQRCGGSQ